MEKKHLLNDFMALLREREMDVDPDERRFRARMHEEFLQDTEEEKIIDAFIREYANHRAERRHGNQIEDKQQRL